MGYRSKPRPGARIAPTGAAARGLLAFLPLNEGCGLPQDVGAHRPAASSNAAWADTFLTFNGTSQWVDLGPRADLSLGGRLTLAFCGNPRTSNAANIIDSHNYPTNTQGCGLFSATSSPNSVLTYFASGTSYNSSSGAIDGNEHVFAVSHNSTGTNGIRFNRDGIPWGATTGAYPNAYAGRTVIGGRSESGAPTARWYLGSLRWVGIWGRGLSDDEMALYFAAPDAIYQYLFPRRRPIAAAAAPPSASLSRRTLYVRAGSRGVAC